MLIVTNIIHIPSSVLQKSQYMGSVGYVCQQFWMGFPFANLAPTTEHLELPVGSPHCSFSRAISSAISIIAKDLKIKTKSHKECTV